MPIYDYRCGGCGRRLSLLFRTFAAAEQAACPHCASTELTRLVTRFSVGRSEERRLDDLADDSSFADLDDADPRAMARWARRMGDELGDDLGPEYSEMIDRLEAGEMPDDEGGMGADDGELDAAPVSDLD